MVGIELDIGWKKMALDRAATAVIAALMSASSVGQASNIEEVIVIGNPVGKGETRANVKIDVGDIVELPAGVGAAQMLSKISGIQVGSSDALGGGGFDSTINMRGFGKDQIGFSIDGIPNGRTTLGGGAVPNRFIDTGNVVGVDVAQSAGVVGAPTRQALVGHINYLTRDPGKEFGTLLEYAGGSHDYSRYFLRVDSGELADGLTSYLSISSTDYNVWIGEGTGEQERFHIDFKVVKEFSNGTTIKFRNSYNDRDAVGYNIVSYLQTPCAEAPWVCFFDPFAPTNPAFTLNENSDGYTDDWTGDPMVDRLYRGTRGNEREDNLTYLELELPITEQITLDVRPYFHTQEGTGRFANHRDEGAVPDPIANDEDPELYFRNNAYEMDRHGVVVQLEGSNSDLFNWTAGAWYEDYNRTQVRTWHELVNPAAGPSFNAMPYHTSEDKEWDNQVTMLYLSNSSLLMDGRLLLDYGFVYLDNDVEYSAPVQDSDDDLFNISSEFSDSSDFAPKFGALYEIDKNWEIFAGYAKNVATISDGVMEDVGDEASSDEHVRIDVDLDEADVYDLGIRYASDTLTFGAQLFSLESTEYKPIDLANSLASTTVSQGRKIQGLELTFKAVSDNFEFYSAITTQQHEYDNEAHVPFTENGEDLVGIPTENAYIELTWKPVENARISLNAQYVSERAGFYADPESSSGLVWSEVENSFVFANASFIAEAPFDHGPSAAQLSELTSSSESIPDYTIFGLDASYQHQNYRFKFSIDNLTDERYLSGVAPELLGVDRKWAGRYFIGAPRTTTFSVSAVF